MTRVHFGRIAPVVAVLLAGPVAAAQEGTGLVVDWRDGTSQETVDREEKSLGIDLRANSAHSADDALTLSDVEATDELLAKLRANPLVEVAEPLVRFDADFQPDDPLYKGQWHLRDIGAPTSWGLASGLGVKVAIVDTGVTFVDDLAAASVKGWDFVDDDAIPDDDVGHGTHVAGTVAQLTDNHHGVAGVAPRATIIPVRVLGRGGGTNIDVADGIDFAVDAGARVINLSLGSSAPSDVVRLAVERAVERGVVVVCAAGNTGDREPHYPGAYPACLTVAATRFDGTLAPYSTHGPFVDLSAPGGDLARDDDHDGEPDGVLQQLPDGSFARYQGTSMATPHVTGAAALLFSAGVSRAAAVESLLTLSARRGSLDPADAGAGKLEAARALAWARFGGGGLRLILGLLVVAGAVFLVRRREGGRFTTVSLLGPFGMLALWLTTVGVPVSIVLGGPAAWASTLSTAGVDLPRLVSEGWGHNLLWCSVLPVGFAAALGRIGGLRGIAFGVAAGFTAFLLAGAVTGSVEVAGVPGRWLEAAWLGVNGILGAAVVTVALKGAMRRTL